VQVVTAIATSALTAAIVTAALTAILRHVFDKRLLRMEKELNRMYDIIQEIDKQRRQTFQRVAARVHRVRSKAKEFVENDSTGEEPLNAFRDATRRLEDDLSKLRLILEEEDLYREVHAFKNDAKGLAGLFDDLVLQRDQSDEEQIQQVRASISESFGELDLKCVNIIDHLTTRSSRTIAPAPTRGL
jgi:predicted nuclease with TOPRIM domain